MPIQKISIQDFLTHRNTCPVLDVRSPGEYDHARIPGAYTLPLFSDEERKDVGTLYKQQGKQKAIKAGLDYFGVKMRAMVEEAEKIIKEWKKQHPGQWAEQDDQPVIVHCWRGGMRSAGVAWLLDLYGFKVKTLVGGYKAYRRWVLEQFTQPYDISILGGYTGSRKTDILQHMGKHGHAIIDLEGLANHKGSAFGAFGQAPQPSQEMFENQLALQLYQNKDKMIWMEDESQRIGKLTIPHALWQTMRQKPVYFLDIPFEERLAYLLQTYSGFEKEKYVNAVMRIQKRLGPLETRNTIGFLLEDDYSGAFRILLAYYDKTYKKSLYNREGFENLLRIIPCSDCDANNILNKLNACATQES